MAQQGIQTFQRGIDGQAAFGSPGIQLGHCVNIHKPRLVEGLPSANGTVDNAAAAFYNLIPVSYTHLDPHC